MTKTSDHYDLIHFVTTLVLPIVIWYDLDNDRQVSPYGSHIYLRDSARLSTIEECSDVTQAAKTGFNLSPPLRTVSVFSAPHRLNIGALLVPWSDIPLLS